MQCACWEWLELGADVAASAVPGYVLHARCLCIWASEVNFAIWKLQTNHFLSFTKDFLVLGRVCGHSPNTICLIVFSIFYKGFCSSSRPIQLTPCVRKHTCGSLPATNFLWEKQWNVSSPHYYWAHTNRVSSCKECKQQLDHYLYGALLFNLGNLKESG